ncbi:MAG: porin [Sporocytophaga sp.]|uniref:porin n=1 Tax=Sporocytophaga sp. TaxID=2231183 RepID=UPI001B2D6E38|nr:porin [Sporocytophaga sp.]MBO9703345.1 porin [Sporocytophaga sp.]
MKKRVLVRVFIVLMILPIFVEAQEKDSLRISKNNVNLWGYADIYYGYNFNQPPSRVDGEMVNGNIFLYSHNRHNEFNINNGIVGLEYSKDRVRGAFALQSGTYVQYNYAAEPAVLRNIFEAYAGYMVANKLWIDAGIFASHIGSESAISFNDLTLSRSMMADNTPYYETGVKATYEVNDQLLLTGLALNGWQNITDHNKNKALGSQIQYKPHEKVLINYSTFYGKEAGAYENTTEIVNTDSLSTRRFFNDLYVQATFNKLTILAAFDIGFQKKLNSNGDYVWWNPNLILKCNITDKIALAARGEYYNDKNGVIINSGTVNGFQTFSGSLGLNLKLTEHMIWKIEGKAFESKDKVFINNAKTSNSSILVLSSVAFKF